MFTRIATKSEIFRNVVYATQTAAKKSKFVLCELRSFVYEYPVKFLPSIFRVARFIALEVPELNN